MVLPITTDPFVTAINLTLSSVQSMNPIYLQILQNKRKAPIPSAKNPSLQQEIEKIYATYQQTIRAALDHLTWKDQMEKNLLGTIQFHAHSLQPETPRWHSFQQSVHAWKQEETNFYLLLSKTNALGKHLVVLKQTEKPLSPFSDLLLNRNSLPEDPTEELSLENLSLEEKKSL